MSEAELLRRAQHGDGDAFAELCGPHARRAFNLALRLCGDPDRASDACQRAWLSAFRSVRRRRDAPLDIWLLAIVRRTCMETLRRSAPWPAAARPAAQPAVAPPSPDLADPTARREQAWAEALMRLRPEWRAAVVLHDQMGLSAGEAAYAAGVPTAVLRARLRQGRAELRGLLRASGILQEREGLSGGLHAGA